MSYQYDAAGNRTRLTWPDGYYVQYAYDALHRLTTATENGTFVLVSATYDPLSRVTGVAKGNGTSGSVGYSTFADLLSLAHNFVGSSVTLTNTYTPAHQQAAETASNAVWQFAPATFETTNYAAANNLNQYTQVTKGANPTVTLAYDASGNLTGDGTWTFAYDAENKLRQATKSGTTASYAYDPLLRREGKTVNGVTTTFLLDGAEEIGEYDGNGAMLRRYVPSNTTDAPIAMIEGTGGGTVRKWFHRNRLGSTIAMSDGAGAVSEGPITYDAFGNSASTGGVAFKYTGRRYDTETGLYYYRARYYSPSLGRFMQTDPIGSCDNMNLYAYVNNDPINRRDPSGLAEETPPIVEHVTVWGRRQDRDEIHRLLEDIERAHQDGCYGACAAVRYGSKYLEEDEEEEVERVVVTAPLLLTSKINAVDWLNLHRLWHNLLVAAVAFEYGVIRGCDVETNVLVCAGPGRTRCSYVDVVANCDGNFHFIEVKTGGAGLERWQQDVKNAIEDGTAVPYGDNATRVGLRPGVTLGEQGITSANGYYWHERGPGLP